MNQLRKLLKATGITSDQLSEKMGMTTRALAYHYTTGRMPFAIVYKLHLVTGVPISEIVPKYLAENWLFLFEEQLNSNKPRGGTAIKQWKKETDKKVVKDETWSKNLELTEPTADQLPEERIKAPRETSVEQVTESSIPKSVTPKKPKSIAELMKEAPPVIEGGETPPDFSNLDDSIFSTSADQNPVRKRK